MDLKQIDDELSVCGQIGSNDVERIARQGYKAIICNRPDQEESGQPSFAEISQDAEKQGLAMLYLPVVSGKITEAKVTAFTESVKELPKPILAYCRTGTRCTELWALSAVTQGMKPAEVSATAQGLGYDLKSIQARLGKSSLERGPAAAHYNILIIGAGAGGLSVASSILKRAPQAQMAIIEPAEKHYYQPGWTLVGAGVFKPQQTERTMASLMPRTAKWLKASVVSFDPANNLLRLDDGRAVSYDRLVVAAGLKLNWDGVEGLTDSLGHHGVTSNYSYDLAPYTWKLVQELRGGNAIFTQPPMPIKCAGAPQKAMYLSADYWHRKGLLEKINVKFFNAGPVLFGVEAYVPALMNYIQRYQVELNFSHNLTKVDVATKTAWFDKTDSEGNKETVKTGFDMIHVCPPQQAPDFIRNSPLVDGAGWVDVDPETLAHKVFGNIWALGDVMNAPNAKTAAAARMQAPVVAHNVLADCNITQGTARYNGYGSCPLTVAKGKIVLAEFGYGGKLLPSFPSWLIDGTKPSRAAWSLKKDILPFVYWNGMLKGREWLVKPSVSAAKIQ